MGLWSKLFGNTSNQRPRDPIVDRMASDDEETSLSGLGEAVRRAESGDISGLTAIREAIRVRSGKEAVDFYQPGLVAGRGDQLAERLTQSRPKLIELAKSGALLRDPRVSGDLLSAALTQVRDHGALEALTWDMYNAGGANQGFAFQLLYNEQRYSIEFAGKC